MSPSLVDSALNYARRGWPVLPLHTIRDGWCSCGKANCASPGKHPIGVLVPNGMKNASMDEATIREWWSRSPDANVGIRTGAESGLAVVDCDTPEALEAFRQRCEGSLPKTPKVKTRRGWHFYFRHSETPVPTRAGILYGLDIKGDGGYVVAPPSVNGNGGRYEWEIPPEEVDLVPVAAGLLELCQENDQTDVPIKPPRMLCGVPEGQRDITATSLAGTYVSMGLDPVEVLTLLREWNRHNGPPLSDDQLQKVVASVAKADRRNHPERWAIPAGPYPLREFLALELPRPPSTVGNKIIIPGGLTIVGAQPKIGKSNLMQQLALTRGGGQDWLQFPTAPGRTLYINAEIPAWEFQGRFEHLLGER